MHGDKQTLRKTPGGRGRWICKSWKMTDLVTLKVANNNTVFNERITSIENMLTEILHFTQIENNKSYTLYS